MMATSSFTGVKVVAKATQAKVRAGMRGCGATGRGKRG
jgi:hypothetical protein